MEIMEEKSERSTIDCTEKIEIVKEQSTIHGRMERGGQEREGGRVG